MKSKILSSILASFMVISLLPYLSVNLAYADHGDRGDNNNRGGDGEHGVVVQAQNQQVQNQQSGGNSEENNRQGNQGNNNQLISQSSSNSSNVNNNESGDDNNRGSGSISSNNSGHGDNDNENENENEDNNVNNVNLDNNGIRALIERLTQLVAQLQAQLQALLGQAHAPVISNIAAINVSSTNATITWVTDQLTSSTVYFSTTSPVNTASAQKVTDNTFSVSHSVNLTGLTANTIYFFIVESKNGAATISQSAQSSFTTLAAQVNNAPIISAVAVNSATSSALVTWTTDKLSTSKVYFSTTSPVNLGTASTVVNNTLVTSHSLTLSGLSASTTYFFIVESIDSSNNVSRTNQLSFTTSQDLVAPVISAITLADVSSTRVEIHWLTNESASSQAFYSVNSPVNLVTASTTLDNTLVTSHSLTLSGLTASTTYFVVLQSKDSSNNAATSSQISFVTLP